MLSKEYTKKLNKETHILRHSLSKAGHVCSPVKHSFASTQTLVMSVAKPAWHLHMVFFPSLKEQNFHKCVKDAKFEESIWVLCNLNFAIIRYYKNSVPTFETSRRVDAILGASVLVVCTLVSVGTEPGTTFSS